MPKGCCVPCCPSTERNCGNTVSFHEVPSDDRRRGEWVYAIAGDNAEERVRLLSNARSVVCSLHFKPTDFKVGMKRRVLVSAAVPSIFPDAAVASMELPLRKRRRRRTKEPYYYYNVNSVKGAEDAEEEDATPGVAVANDARAQSRPPVVPETTTIMILPGMVIRHER